MLIVEIIIDIRPINEIWKENWNNQFYKLSMNASSMPIPVLLLLKRIARSFSNTDLGKYVNPK